MFLLLASFSDYFKIGGKGEWRMGMGNGKWEMGN